ncbi:MAG: branched-chain amino acid ABC transporter substrate-binding protein [Acidobacteria bacterium]|nr:branched-chain amino acid ABC transporter substrate-binding protein [Acidobacteriota bacterium]
MKKTRLFGLAVGFALIAAACGGGVDFDAGVLGAVEVGPDEQIQIRSLQAITGDVAFLGIPNQRGTELAITDFGDIEGHSVTIGTGLDDLCNAEGGQAAAQTITADDKVVGVIGTSCSGAAAAASPLISDAGLVMISPSNTSPSLTSDLKGNAGKDYRPGYYRTAHNDLFQGQAVAEFAYNDLGMRKAAAIHDGDPYTDGLATAFSDAFQKLGGEMVVYTSVNKGDTDMSAVLTEVAAGSPDMLFFPIFPAEGIPIAQQVGGVPGLENITLIVADGLLVDNFMEIPEASGIYYSGPDLNFGNNTSPTGTNAESFLAAYEAAYGEAPTAPFWAHSYDATIMLLTAIKKIAVVDGDTIFIDRQLLRDELDKTSGFSGIIGTITCDDFGDCGAQRIAIILNNSPNDLDAAKANVVFTFSP